MTPAKAPFDDRIDKSVAGGPPHSEEISESQVDTAVVAFRMLADPNRVRMLWRLRQSPADVATLAEAAGCTPTATSQHLAKLKLAGLVDGQREGRHVVYRLTGGHVKILLTEALFHAEHQVTGEPFHD